MNVKRIFSLVPNREEQRILELLVGFDEVLDRLVVELLDPLLDRCWAAHMVRILQGSPRVNKAASSTRGSRALSSPSGPRFARSDQEILGATLHANGVAIFEMR